jgi:gliding motility-associated-like protein
VFTVTINLFPSPEINEVITTIGCSYTDDLCTSSIEISPVGFAPFTYNWVSLDGNPIVNPTDRDQFDLCPGVYELAITDSSNCTYVYQYEVPPPDPVEFTLITLTDISCNNVGVQPCDGSIEVETVGGITPYNLVEWYTETIPDSGVFDFGPLINVNDPNQLVNACEGNYILKVLDDSGCEFISPVYTINQIVDPIILTEIISNYNGFNIDCNAANSGTITIDLSGGSGVFEYSFVEDATGDVLETDTVTSVSTTLEFDFLIAGDYTLTIEDPNCSSLITRNYTLTQPDELVITATLVDPINCFGGLATYDITATGGVPPYTGTGLQDVLSGPFTFVVSDANGCEDDFSTVVAEPAELLAIYTTDDAPCFGDFGQVNVLPTGGTGILTVNLYDENNIFITNLNTTTGVPVTFNQLANTYFYEVIDENTCRFGPQAITIDEPDPINITDFEVIQPDCNTTPAWEFDNGSICITITGGTNPFPVGTAWVDNGGGQWCLNNLSAGTYPIDVTDINNCSLQNPFPDITLVRPPEITAVITNTIDIDCDTDTATQINTIIVNGGVPPYQVTWSGGIVDAANPFVMQTSVPGNYSAFVNDQYGIINGCPPIEFPLDPIAFFEFGLADFTMSSANSDFCDVFAVSDPIYFTNISTGDITSFSWNFGDGSPTLTGVDTPVHVYDALGTYTISLTVEDLYGCFDTYFQTIDITKGYEIILPNAFTPNGDGINETIRPVSNCMTKIKMSIYDTWGSLIYVEVAENQDIYGWDGTIDGNPAENGNYIMVVEATTFNGAVIDLNGPVTLIK